MNGGLENNFLFSFFFQFSTLLTDEYLTLYKRDFSSSNPTLHRPPPVGLSAITDRSSVQGVSGCKCKMQNGGTRTSSGPVFHYLRANLSPLSHPLNGHFLPFRQPLTRFPSTLLYRVHRIVSSPLLSSHHGRRQQLYNIVAYI